MNIGSFLAASARSFPERPAVSVGGDLYANYADFFLRVTRLATALHGKWKVERMAPGHCTGEPAFAAFRKAFGDQYIYAGLGSVVELP